jgi:hypothetical protein
MNIFTTLEQSKKLKAAGFKFTKCKYLKDSGEKTCDYVKCPSSPTNVIFNCYFPATIQEIMEELVFEIDKIEWFSETGWHIKLHDSLTKNFNLMEALVDAYCRSKEVAR